MPEARWASAARSGRAARPRAARRRRGGSLGAGCSAAGCSAAGGSVAALGRGPAARRAARRRAAPPGRRLGCGRRLLGDGRLGDRGRSTVPLGGHGHRRQGQREHEGQHEHPEPRAETRAAGCRERGGQPITAEITMQRRRRGFRSSAQYTQRMAQARQFRAVAREAVSRPGQREQFRQRRDARAGPRVQVAGPVDEHRAHPGGGARPRSRTGGGRRSGAPAPARPRGRRGRRGRSPGRACAAPTTALAETAAKRSPTPSPSRTSPQAAVPVADHAEAQAGGGQRVERGQGVREQLEAQGVHEDLGQPRQRRDVIAEPLGKDARAHEPQGRERRAVAPLVVVGAVVERSPRQGPRAPSRAGGRAPRRPGAPRAAPPDRRA